MKHEDFTMRTDGFVGHLAEPDNGSDRAVVVIMGGEQSILPGIKFAERFADYGITGLAVSLFGAEGLPDSPNKIPLDMFVPAVEYLRQRKHIERISVKTIRNADKIVVLDGGNISSGTHEDLMKTSPKYSNFIRLREEAANWKM